MRTLFQFIIKFIASGFGAGFFPLAPGTIGTVVGLGAWFFLGQSGYINQGPDYVVLLIGTIIIGLITAHLCVGFGKTEEEGKFESDPQYVVIDEWAGLFITLYGVGFTNYTHAIIGFILFRIFDIVKPEPCGALENLPGGIGVMADDIAAGIYAYLAFAVLQALIHF